MANKTIKYLMRNNADFNLKPLKKQVTYSRFLYSVLVRCKSHWSKSEDGENPISKEAKGASSQPSRPTWDKQTDSSSRVSKYSSDEDDASASRWKVELAWLTKALEPAFQLFRRALPTGNANGNRPPPSSKSVAEIVASIQRSKLGIQDWSLGDLTLGLYLIYLQQASANPLEDVKGLEISSDTVVLEHIYHVELAKGAYRDSTAALARNSMLRESNIVKFVRDSSVLRPGYYIGVDTRNKLVILGIRGTHTVYDIITNIVSSSHEEVTFEGYSSHFGTAEAARWFLHHEMGTIRKYLDKHEGFRLRLVGHSLGGATASLLAMMLLKKTDKELGFSPDIVSAVGIGTPPCVSRELAEACSDYVTTLVLQDDIVPRLSVASLMRLRNEILQTDWATVLEKEDWKGVVDLVTNAKQVVSSVQDVARKLADYTKFGSQAKFSEIPGRKDSLVLPRNPPTEKQANEVSLPVKEERATCTIPELVIPGTVYYLKRNEYKPSSSSGRGIDFFTLLKRHPGEHFQRILLSSNVISDHKCDSHLYALRDVLKGIPASHN